MSKESGSRSESYNGLEPCSDIESETGKEQFFHRQVWKWIGNIFLFDLNYARYYKQILEKFLREFLLSVVKIDLYEATKICSKNNMFNKSIL